MQSKTGEGQLSRRNDQDEAGGSVRETEWAGPMMQETDDCEFKPRGSERDNETNGAAVPSKRGCRRCNDKRVGDGDEWRW